MTSTPADVAALLKITATESATLDALEGCVRRLRDVQAAIIEADCPGPASLDLAALPFRHVPAGWR